MQSLSDFNEEMIEIYRIADANRRNGMPNEIACPKCGLELLDSSPNMVLTSNPPQKDVHCPECGYKGYRIA